MKNVIFDIGGLNCEYMTYIFTEFNKSSSLQIFLNMAIIKNFAIHTEKHLKGWRADGLQHTKKGLQRRCVLVDGSQF